MEFEHTDLLSICASIIMAGTYAAEGDSTCDIGPKECVELAEEIFKEALKKV
jgi:hypothetical protein